MPLEVLLRRLFAGFHTIYLPTGGELCKYGFELLPCWPRSGPPGQIPVR